MKTRKTWREKPEKPQEPKVVDNPKGSHMAEILGIVEKYRGRRSRDGFPR